MPLTPAVGDRYLLTWEDLGKPTVNGDVKVPGLGVVTLDDADIHYALRNQAHAAFYVRKSKALGTNNYVVVSRVQPA
ncbi:MAG: hypothetical protein KF857_01385 [Fimbriimonadaceae bacterium]|nr:hypothetical protein [Fimbriimonadaceae bacterium]